MITNETREFIKKVTICYAKIAIVVIVVLVCLGTYQAHTTSAPKVERDVLWEEITVVEEEPIEIFVPVDVPLIRTTEFVNLTFDEMAFLQQIAMAESRGEDAYGQALVMRTVLNRSARTGKSIRDVFYASGQFTTVDDPMFGHYVPNEANNQAIGMIVDGWTEKDLPVDTEWDKTKDIYYFAAGGYPGYGERAFQWGGHYFCVK